MRAILRFAFGALCLVAAAWTTMSSAAAQAQPRVALVIGNSAYRSVPMLPNPANDAGAVASALEHLGFSVTVLKDAGFDDLRRGLIDFGPKARAADMAVIFYAGHGMEVAGENWLVPVDAQLRADTDVENEAIGLKSLMLGVSGAKSLGLIILDACRTNPFDARMQGPRRTRAVSRGLAPVEPNDNVLVAYAARDGTTAADGDDRNGNSPFTAALLKHIETPGLEINFLFRNVRDDVIAATDHQQQPFVYGSLSKEAIYLAAPPAGAEGAAPASAAPGADDIAWSFLGATPDAALLRRFVEQFPSSPHRPEADARIAALDAGSANPSAPATDGAPAAPAASVDPASVAAQQSLAHQFARDAPQVEAAWSIVKTSSDPQLLRRFVDEYPNAQRRTVVQALGGAPGSGGVLRQLRADQMRAVLSSYGHFAPHPRYGEVWVPSVTPEGWRPYEPCHWVNSKRFGWYYLDRTPWGAIVHHFGRWTHDTQLGWIWVPGVDFSPGWVVWRTNHQYVGWAPMPPVEDVEAISAQAFDASDLWTFMDVATFVRGCSGPQAAPVANVQELLANTTLLRDVKVVGGIAVFVFPTYLVGPVVDVEIVYDPWPAWLIGQVLVGWNWAWNASPLAGAAACPPKMPAPPVLPIVAPAAPPSAGPPPSVPPPAPPMPGPPPSSCPPGTHLQGDACLRNRPPMPPAPPPVIGCPPGLHAEGAACVPNSPPPPPPVCPTGTTPRNGICVGVPPLPPPVILCRRGTHLEGRVCVDNPPPPPPVVICERGTHLEGRVCVNNPPPSPPVIICERGTHLEGRVCVDNAPPPPIVCRRGTHLEGRSCVVDQAPPPSIVCRRGTHLDGRVCVENVPPPLPPIVCRRGTHLEGRACVADQAPPPPLMCPRGTRSVNGACLPDAPPQPRSCPPGGFWTGRECRPIARPPFTPPPAVREPPFAGPPVRIDRPIFPGRPGFPIRRPGPVIFGPRPGPGPDIR